MKTKNLFCALVCMAGLGQVKAADLYVRDMGAGGAYATISAAINAAADGDRIIIRPKAAGLPFIENITINKSLTFVSEINFSKYVLQGTVSITPLAGRLINIHNMSSASTISVSAATIGGRTTLNVMNSQFNQVNAQFSNTSVNMSGCEVSLVNMTHGRLTGNKTGTITISGTTIESNPSDEEIEIIANNISGDVTFNEKNYSFKLLNNYVNSSYLRIEAVKTGTTSEVRNNVINGGTYGSVLISVPAGSANTFFILNNVLTCNTTLSNYYEISNTYTSGATVYALNNASTTNFTTTGVAVSSGNFTSSSIVFNSTTALGAALINAGIADDEYADLDLSRNDIGNFGGSDSWENYWPASVGNKPQVNYLKTPRRIYTGTTEMNATGSGYSK